jgi:hypothetical protein
MIWKERDCSTKIRNSATCFKNREYKSANWGNTIAISQKKIWWPTKDQQHFEAGGWEEISWCFLSQREVVGVLQETATAVRGNKKWLCEGGGGTQNYSAAFDLKQKIIEENEC